MKIISRIALGIAALMLVGVSTACSAGGGSSDGSSSQATSIQLGLVQGQDFIHAMPARVAEAQGFFAKHDVTVTVVDFTSGSDLTKAMAGGSIAVGAATGLDAVSAVAHDVDLQAFWGTYSPSPMALIVGGNSKIKGFADLGGTKVGISRVGSMTDYTVRAALDAAGVSLDGVTEVPLGDPASTMAGLAKGDVDSIVLPVNFGYTVEAEKGGKIAQMAADVIGGADQFGVLMAPSMYISDNKDALGNLTAAYTDALDWMAKHRDETVGLAVDKLGMKKDIAGKTYDALIGQFSAGGSVDVDGLKAYAKSLPALGIAAASPEASAFYNDSLQK